MLKLTSFYVKYLNSAGACTRYKVSLSLMPPVSSCTMGSQFCFVSNETSIDVSHRKTQLISEIAATQTRLNIKHLKWLYGEKST